MEQKSLSNWLKGIIISMGIIGVILYFKILPLILAETLNNLNLLTHYRTWLIIILISAIPCFLVLVCGFLIANNIGNDKSFTKENANYLKIIMILAIIDTIYFFVANVTLYIFKMSSPLIFVISLIIEFAGICISVAAACLSHLVVNAAKLKEESDLTI